MSNWPLIRAFLNQRLFCGCRDSKTHSSLAQNLHEEKEEKENLRLYLPLKNRMNLTRIILDSMIKNIIRLLTKPISYGIKAGVAEES